jgi:hypothetical protein
MNEKAGMRLVVHQGLKDARLLKWILLLWVLLNAALYLVALLAIYKSLEGIDSGSTVMGAYLAIRGLLVGGFVAIPVLVVQNDPGVGTTAFWFTRPITRRVLLGAKFLLMVPALVLLPVLLDLAALLIAGVPFGVAVRPMLEALALQVAWLVPLMAIAALTTDLARFVLGALLEVVIYFVVVAIGPWAVGIRAYHATVSPATTTIVFAATLVIVAFAVLAVAYLSRDLRRGAVAAGVAPVFLGLVVLLWPWEIASVAGPTVSSPVQVRIGALWRVPPLPYTDCLVGASLDLFDVPPAESLQVAAHETWLQYGGKRVDMRNVYVSVADPQGEAQATRAVLQIASGQVLTRNGQPIKSANASYSLFATVPAVPCRELAGERATLEAAIRVTPVTHRVAARIPIAAGSRYQLATGTGEVLEVRRSPVGIMVGARQTGLDTRFGPHVRVSYVLHNRRLGDVLIPSRPRVTTSPFLLMIIPVPQHLVSTWWTLDFRWPDRPGFDADNWLRDAELVVVESRELGVAERHIEVRDVVLSSLPERSPGN